MDDLSQYYEKAAGILGRSKDFLTYEVPFMTGFRARPYSGGDPLRIDEAYAGDFRKSASVDVLLRTNVTELYANEARSAITGFRIFNAVEEHRDVSLTGRQELVLAAGGIVVVVLWWSCRRGE